MSDGLNIARIRAYAVAPAQAPPVRYTGRDDGLVQMNIEVVRLTLQDGSEGTASSFSGWLVSDGGSVVREIGRLAGDVLGESVAHRAALTEALLESAGEGPWPAISIIDGAMWDAYARSAGLPLWQLLGGYRACIPAYASTPAHLTIEAYLDDVRRFAAMGYRAIKLHMNTDPDFDLELVRAVTGAHGATGLRFMVDLERLYSFDDAVRLGEVLSRLPFDWMEAPLPDTDLGAYAELNEAVAIDILAAGNTLVGLENWAEGLGRGAWSRLRCDACNAGGVTTLVKAMGLARAMAVPLEIQSFGFQPSQHVNLHVMLGMAGCTWFEHPAPQAPYNYAARNPLSLTARGWVAAAEGAGLGLVMNWDEVDTDAFARFDSAASG